MKYFLIYSSIKFKLFCNKTIEMLLSNEFDLYTNNRIRFKPLIDFLNNNFKMFNSQLYSSLFKKLLFRLWDQLSKVNLLT